MASSVNKLRLTGLVSGMDTESVIQNLMKIQQLKANRDIRAKTTNMWKTEQYKSVADDLKNFRQTYMSALSSKNMLTSKVFDQFNVSTSGKNTSSVTITAGVGASVGSVTVNSIEQLAKAAKTDVKIGTDGTAQGISTGGGLSTSSTLGSLSLKNAIGFTYTQATDSEGNLMFDDGQGNAVYKDKDSGEFFRYVTEEYDLVDDVTGDPIIDEDTGLPKKGTRQVKEYDNTISESNLTKANLSGSGTMSFKINNTTFTFNENQTLQEVINKVNASDAGVTMKYSQLTDQITFESKDTGKDASFTLSNVEGGGNIFGANGAFAVEEKTYEGKNAIVTIDGVRTEKQSNTFTIDGISYTLNDVTNEETTAKVTRNIDGTVDSIKSFVEAYNSMISKLNDLVRTRKTSSESSYTPLTDEEKAEMTDKQIEEWETIAKKGLLYNDQGIKNLMSDLRSALYEKVAGAGLSPADIGIRTGYDYTNGGQITLDEDILRSSLEKDPDAVAKVFTDIGSTSGEMGFLNRVNDLLYKYEKGTNYNTVNGLEKDLKKLNEKIETMEAKMLAMEEKYYKQFAAMETAMAKLQEQSSSLTSLLGGGG